MRGVSYRGDIGLDDISFTDGPCCKLQMSIDLSRSEIVLWVTWVTLSLVSMLPRSSSELEIWLVFSFQLWF